MEYGSLTPTVDIFEVFWCLALIFGVPLVGVNLRQSWDEKEWAIDSADPSFRRLGVIRYENARLLALAMFLLAVGAVSGLLVPSTVFQEAGVSGDFSDFLNAVIQRMVPVAVVLFLGYKAWNDIEWRRYVEQRRRTSPSVRAAAAAQEAATAEAVGLAELEGVTESAPVVEAPVVVVPAEAGGPSPADTQTLKNYHPPEREP